MTIVYKNPKQQEKAKKILMLLTREGIDQDTIYKFIEWFFDNQETWKAFKDVTNKAMQANKKFGAKAISEICRWQIEIEKNGEYKFNNNYTAYLARLYNANVKHEYFETREVRGLAA